MKVLIDHRLPFFLAHGGYQIQIERIVDSLLGTGLEVAHARWWDSTQVADVIHVFGRFDARYIRLAQAKGMRVVLTDLLGGLGARSALGRLVQKALMNTARTALPKGLMPRLAWDSYRLACGMNTDREARLLRTAWSRPSSILSL